MEEYVVKGTGVILTDEMIDALAAEAEQGYDLSQGEVVHVGRPALEKGTAPSPRITVRAAASLYKAVHDRAAAENRSVSDVARAALEAYVRG